MVSTILYGMVLYGVSILRPCHCRNSDHIVPRELFPEPRYNGYDLYMDGGENTLEDTLPVNDVEEGAQAPPSQDIVMDISELDEEFFEVEEDEESGGVSSGIVVPIDNYQVIKVVYADHVLWESEDDYKCTHVEVHINKDILLAIIGYEKDGTVEYKAKQRRFNGEWQDARDFDEVLVNMLDDPNNPLASKLRPRRGG